MKRVASLLLSCLLVSALLVVTNASAGEYHFDSESGSFVNAFLATNLFKFNAETEHLDGKMVLSPDGDHPMQAEFSVPVKTLDTLNKSRNRHMREDYLHADQYPSVMFRLKSLKQTSEENFQPGSRTLGQFVGTMRIHGVEKQIEGDAKVEMSQDSKQVTIYADFPLKLSDYQIERPTMLLLKMKDKLSVRVTARGRLR